MEISKEISEFVLNLVDKVSTYRVPANIYNDLMKKRAIYESQRESNVEKKKEAEEKLRKEKEDKWANMSAKDRKKAMEVEQKRARNRGMKKMKVN